MSEKTKTFIKDLTIMILIPALLVFIYIAFDDDDEYTYADVCRIQEEAYQEGYEDGYEDGIKK